MFLNLKRKESFQNLLCYLYIKNHPMYYYIPRDVFSFSYLESNLHVMIYFTCKMYEAHYIMSCRYFMMIFQKLGS